MPIILLVSITIFIPVTLLAFMPTLGLCLRFLTILLFCYIPTLVSQPKFSTSMLSYYIPALVFCFKSLNILLSHYILVFYYKILALLFAFRVFSLYFHLRSSFLRTFKQTLSDKPKTCISTSFAKFFCLFLSFSIYNLNNNNGLYNLTNTKKRKQDFNTLFINSCLLAGNYK